MAAQVLDAVQFRFLVTSAAARSLQPSRLPCLQSGRQTSGVAYMRRIIESELDSIREAGTWKHERVISSPQGSSIRVSGSSDQILNFCANNYLGLSVRSLHLFCFKRCFPLLLSGLWVWRSGEHPMDGVSLLQSCDQTCQSLCLCKGI